MRTSLYLAMLITAGWLVSTVQAAEIDMQEGLWEIRSTTEMPGMPFSMPETSYRQCITRQDLVPQPQQAEQQCKMLENSTSGNTVKWKVVCTSEEGKMTSEGSLTYHGDRFEGTIKSSGPQLPGGMTQKMAGQRVGACR